MKDLHLLRAKGCDKKQNTTAACCLDSVLHRSLCVQTCSVFRDNYGVYRARPSVHRALVELLPHGEGDVGGADRGGRFDGQLLSVLRDLYQRLRGSFHCDHAQHHVHA